MRERFEELRRMGIRTVMITGDNRLTAAAIASEAGVDDFLAEAIPERKLELIHGEQERGRLVAMIGDGTNDAPALAQADVAVAMNTGTAAAKEAGNMVDLDSNPTKLIDIVEIGKQLLITRGALTTFSVANDVAKYFAIVPAMFAPAYPVLDRLNVLRLESPESAILSAVIFNALVILALVPLALRGVRYRAAGATASAQPGDLRPWWRAGAVRGDQADRPVFGADRVNPSLPRAVRITLVLTLLTGPPTRWPSHLVAQGALEAPADGSLIVRDGRVVGSSLIGQAWEGPEWFHGRPSAVENDARTSGGSNLGPTSRELSDVIAQRAAMILELERPYRPGIGVQDIPVDLLTASASGLDPDVSPEAAAFQVPRIGQVRGLSSSVVLALIDEHTHRSSAGLGAAHVNVLELNLALEDATTDAPLPS